jgi:hypothetical protein
MMMTGRRGQQKGTQPFFGGRSYPHTVCLTTSEEKLPFRNPAEGVDLAELFLPSLESVTAATVS